MSQAQTTQSDEIPKKSSEKVSKDSGSGQTSGKKSKDEKTPKPKKRSTVPVVIWTVTSFFDWNPKYLVQLRGIMNIIHLILSLTIAILLGSSCQLRPYSNSPSEGFFCKPPETFLFIVSCSSFFTSTLMFLCCLLSKRTDSLLFETSYEISYFVMYFILFLTASVAVMISSINWGAERDRYGSNYDITQASAIIGLLNSFLYGISSIWFFISHSFQENVVADRSESTE